MKSLDVIRAQIARGSFKLTRHALRRTVERSIGQAEIREAGADAEIVENYPHDRYSPSALLLGFTASGRPLHFQVSLNETSYATIITLYEPDPDEWINHRIRK